MRAFVARGGSIVLITHKLRDALEFADDITVLRRGRVVLTTRARDVDEQTLARSDGSQWRDNGSGEYP